MQPTLLEVGFGCQVVCCGVYIYSNYLNQFDTCGSPFSDILLVDVLGVGFLHILAGTLFTAVSDGVVDDIFVEGRENRRVLMAMGKQNGLCVISAYCRPDHFLVPSIA